MRRITLWLVSTVAALILLCSYRTSTMGAGGSVGTAVENRSGDLGGPVSSADPGGAGGATGDGTTGSGSGTDSGSGTGG